MKRFILSLMTLFVCMIFVSTLFAADPAPPGQAMKDKKGNPTDTAKTKQLDNFKDTPNQEFLTTNQGLRVNDDQNSLKAGVRGPTIMEDFHFREKITHFDHERIPERVVHARGFGAHGYFQVYDSLAKLTRAKFLQDPSVKTPVFVRFSTVVGSRGSTDLARDVRGFAVKFYTQEGNFDLVGNNMPVFFIQDAIKFPDLIHAVKPEPQNEIPQAQSAHSTFWDFITATPESMHMVMWLMSDRAIPRSYRMMEGFGVHTFRLVDDKGKARFVKFHWKPLLGVHSVVWDEAQKISGKDPDFHRRDLWEAIEMGMFPEWELGIQVVEEQDEHKFAFDLLDPTKIIPEELVPVQRVGKMVLNRNTDNFFAETEQVAFHLGNVVPGIDFTNDPLLQGRLFSYLDTQLIRLGGPNFHEIPINRPIAPINNNQRDGYHRQTINTGRTSYGPNNIAGNLPYQAKQKDGGYVTYAEKVDGVKIRARSESFLDHYSQARLFWNSMTDPEKTHIINAFRFELGKCDIPVIRQRVVFMLSKVDGRLAEEVAKGLGMSVPSKSDIPPNMNVPADADPKKYEPKEVKLDIQASPALSQLKGNKEFAKTRKVAILAANGFDEPGLKLIKEELSKAGLVAKIVAPMLGTLTAGKTNEVIDFTPLTGPSVVFDAVVIPGGQQSVDMLKGDPEMVHFVAEAFKHCKPIAVSGEGMQLFQKAVRGTDQPPKEGDRDWAVEGVLFSNDPKANDKLMKDFVNALGQHRFWIRETKGLPPA